MSPLVRVGECRRLGPAICGGLRGLARGPACPCGRPLGPVADGGSPDPATWSTATPTSCGNSPSISC